ncbi:MULTISPECIES: hypothetical protein [Pseudomonas]|uniref:Uncharacterized protein n=1 Tax=Pseudomonas sessilinigenes TaxID=658629 RepID=A0ABX8MFW3_9PSED|nr:MULTISPECIES: hypothetical protein [Pseudomonas]AZC24961.1 hypothetical protein C4K39_3288 [Pseudomonas sessilinigenes]QIH10249.1 hypothetical protein ATY02_27750 [Pseudomonas sp. BIOMIG1BAC]QXH38002.1 hypothetical protein KSS89_17085 [Pseudomonas sessilinigenes]UMZ10513.1 hypothetical protein I9018_23920 [Pseudomonas sp. MPFS]
MLVNAQNSVSVQPTSRTDMDPTTAAASALYSGMLQQAQNSVTVPASQSSQQQQINSVTDNVNAAFAKTRVLLQQATPPATSAPQANNATQSDAMSEFKDYMSKTPEQRLRDSILQEMGLTEDDLQSMSPERLMAINQEISQRMQDKLKLAKQEQQSNDSMKPVEEKFLASL